jgi:hypothetical protein
MYMLYHVKMAFPGGLQPAEREMTLDRLVAFGCS